MKTKITLAATILILCFLTLTSIAQNKSNVLITATSVGPLKLGMTVGEARRVLTGLTIAAAPGSEGYSSLGAYEGEKLILELGAYFVQADENGELPPIDENEKISSIGVIDSRYSTAEGVRVGTTIADAEKYFGKLKSIFFDQHSGEFGEFTNAPGGFTFMLSGKDDSTGAGNYEGTEQLDYGQRTTKYNPGSVISSISISLPQPGDDGTGASFEKRLQEFTNEELNTAVF